MQDKAFKLQFGQQIACTLCVFINGDIWMKLVWDFSKSIQSSKYFAFHNKDFSRQFNITFIF